MSIAALESVTTACQTSLQCGLVDTHRAQATLQSSLFSNHHFNLPSLKALHGAHSSYNKIHTPNIQSIYMRSTNPNNIITIINVLGDIARI